MQNCIFWTETLLKLGKKVPQSFEKSKIPNIETSKTPVIFSDFGGQKKIPLKHHPVTTSEIQSCISPMTSPGTDLSSRAFCVWKDVGNYISIDNTTSFLHKKNISSPKLETSSHVSQKKTQKPLKTRSRLAAPQRFPCPSRGTNCPIHLCRWRCQLPGQGQVFNQQTPLFKLEKSPKRKAKKKDHLPNPFQQPSNFSGATKSSNFSGGIPGFFQHIHGGDIPRLRPSHAVSISGNLDPLFSLGGSGCLKSLFKPRFDELRKTNVIINLGKPLKTIWFCHK